MSRKIKFFCLQNKIYANLLHTKNKFSRFSFLLGEKFVIT